MFSSKNVNGRFGGTVSTGVRKSGDVMARSDAGTDTGAVTCQGMSLAGR